MQKLIQGLRRFQPTLFGSQRKLFEHQAEGQYPEVLFITCSDSRINPNHLTQTGPEELFILNNAVNIVPPSDAALGGEAVTIEFAVACLGIKDIIVCGHSHCGAMKGAHRYAPIAGAAGTPTGRLGNLNQLKRPPRSR